MLSRHGGRSLTGEAKVVKEKLMQALAFLAEQQGDLIGVVEGRTMNLQSGKIESRKFLLLAQ